MDSHSPRDTSRKVTPHRDTLWLAGADGLNLLIGIAIHVILTRTLLSKEYGMFVLLLDLFHVIVILIDLGLPTLIGRDGGKLGNLLPRLLNRVAGLQMMLMIPLAAGIFITFGWMESAWKFPALTLAAAAGLQVVAYSFRAAFRALGEARLEALIRVIDRAVVALLMGGWAESLPQLAAASALGPAIALLVAFAFWRGGIEPNLSAGDDTVDTHKLGRRGLVKSGLPFLVAAGALVITVRIEKLMLGLFATPNDVAVFQIAWLGFIAGYAPVLSLRAVLLSWFGEVRKDATLLAFRYKRALIAVGILAPIGVAIGYLVGGFAILSFFPESNSSSKPYTVLLVAWVFHLLASPSLALIQVGERPWNYTRILWVGIAVSAAGCAFLIPRADVDLIAPAMAAAQTAAAAAFVVLALAFSITFQREKRGGFSNQKE